MIFMRVVGKVFSIIAIVLIIIGAMCAIFSGAMLKSVVELKHQESGKSILAILFSAIFFVVIDFLGLIAGTAAVVPGAINFVRHRTKFTAIVLCLASLVLIACVTILILFIVL